jgi:RNA polymerase sigma-70 factor (ECF subfamily)
MDQEAFTRRFMEHRGQLLAYVRSFIPDPVEAEEVLQSTAVALWAKAEKYDPSRPFIAWAMRFALVEVRRFRADNKHRSLHLDEAMVESINDAWPARIEEASERRAALRHCLQSLADAHRRLVYDRYYGNRTVQELATTLGESDSTLYKTFRRIRRSLLVCIGSRLARQAGA